MTKELLQQADEAIKFLELNTMNQAKAVTLLFVKSQAKLIKELSTRVREQEWQDISTAPKDGKIILTCGDVPKFIRVCNYNPNVNEWDYYPYGSNGFKVQEPYWWRSLDSLNVPMHHGGGVTKPIQEHKELTNG